MFVGTRGFYSELKLFISDTTIKTTIKNCHVKSQSKPSVKIPDRIQRNPTDILKALSCTVQRDATAFHYQHPDDPFFTVNSNLNKRKILLSLESGKKSAKWIFEQHPEFFKNTLSDPYIKAYDIQKINEENSLCDEETLKNAINDRKVSVAISLYDSLEKNHIEISRDTKLNLLELVCFYNCQDVNNKDEILIKWFEIESRGLVLKNWKDDNFAEKLFNSLGSDCPRACSTIILGRLKYNQLNKALELFEEAKKKDMSFPVSVYNGVIENTNFILEGYEKRWAFVETLLKEMEVKHLKPNLYTLNAVLKVLYQMKNWRSAFDNALRVFNEFKKLNVSPSLGSYKYLMCILGVSKIGHLKSQTFFEELLVDLSKRKLEVIHPSDLNFFFSVMEIFSCTLKNVDLAILLNRILWKSDHMKFFSGNVYENLYYKNYLNIIFEMQPLDSAMKTYRYLVPSVYIPEIHVNQNILKAIVQERKFEHLGKIWEDIKAQDVSKQPKILESLLEMVSEYQEEEVDDVWKIFGEAAEIALDSSDENLIFLNNEVLLVNIFKSLLKNGKKNKFFDVVSKISVDFLYVNGAILKSFCDLCVSKKEYSLVLDCIRYAEKKNFPEVFEMAANVVAFAPTLAANLPDGDSLWLKDLADKFKNSQ